MFAVLGKAMTAVLGLGQDLCVWSVGTAPVCQQGQSRCVSGDSPGVSAGTVLVCQR